MHRHALASALYLLLASCSAPAGPPAAGTPDASFAFDASGAAPTGDAGAAGNGRLAPVALIQGETKELDLAPLSPALAGCKLRYTVELTGNPATLAKLKAIALVGGPSTGVHLRSPSFAIYDPADLSHPLAINTDFAGQELVIGPNDVAPFSPSLVLLTGYRAGRLVDFGASVAEPFNGSLDMKPNDPSVQCKNVSGFAAFKPLLMGQGGIALNCHGCHFAGRGGFWTYGFDNPAVDAQSCVTTLLVSNVATPSMTSFYQSVSVGGHAGGTLSAANSQTLLNALTTWLSTEK